MYDGGRYACVHARVHTYGMYDNVHRTYEHTCMHLSVQAPRVTRFVPCVCASEDEIQEAYKKQGVWRHPPVAGLCVWSCARARAFVRELLCRFGAQEGLQGETSLGGMGHFEAGAGDARLGAVETSLQAAPERCLQNGPVSKPTSAKSSGNVGTSVTIAMGARPHKYESYSCGSCDHSKTRRPQAVVAPSMLSYCAVGDIRRTPCTTVPRTL